jgi:hypothetical protein
MTHFSRIFQYQESGERDKHFDGLHLDVLGSDVQREVIIPF